LGGSEQERGCQRCVPACCSAFCHPGRQGGGVCRWGKKQWEQGCHRQKRGV